MYSELLEFDDDVIRPQSFDPGYLVPIIEEKLARYSIWFGLVETSTAR